MSETFAFESVVWATAAAVLVLTLGGCTVTKELTYDRRLSLQNEYFSPKEATDKLKGRVATIHAWSDSSRFNLVEIKAEYVRVRRDSTLWMDERNGRAWAVPTDHVAMITYQRDHAAADGFGIGILAGLPAGGLAALLTWWQAGILGDYDGHWSGGLTAYLGGLFIGTITFGASILLGTLIGASHDGGETIIVVNGFTPPGECVPSTEFPCGYRK